EVVHRLAVDRIEVDAVELPTERHAQAVHGEGATVRNRDVLADPRRSERLAALQHFHEGLLGLVVQLEQATSSFKTSSLVVLCSCRLMASSAKNSRKRTS